MAGPCNGSTRVRYESVPNSVPTSAQAGGPDRPVVIIAPCEAPNGMGYSASCWYAIDWNDMPVQRRDAELLDRGAVLGRGVADVGGELPARVALLHPLHEAVARDLGDHGGGGDRGRGGVAADDVALLEARRRDREAVGQADAALDADAAQRVDNAARLVLCRPRSSIPRTQREVTATSHGGAQHARVQHLAHLQRVLLGVVERAQRAPVRQRERLVVEQHGGGDQRARPGSRGRPRRRRRRSARRARGRTGRAGCRRCAA